MNPDAIMVNLDEKSHLEIAATPTPASSMEPASSLQPEKLPDKNSLILEQLTMIFGLDAKIAITDNTPEMRFKKTIVIQSKLQEGSTFTDGGQDILIRTHEPTNLKTLNKRGDEVEINGFLVESMAINGNFEITEDFAPILFSKDTELWHIGTASHILGPGNHGDNRIIYLENLQSADDLAILLHEQGHHDTTGESFYVEQGPVQNQFKRDLGLSKDELAQLPPEQIRGFVNRWLYYLNTEVAANRAILKRFNGVHKKQWSEIFPKDSFIDYAGMIRFIENINMNPLINAHDGWYQQNMQEDQREIFEQIKTIIPQKAITYLPIK